MLNGKGKVNIPMDTFFAWIREHWLNFHTSHFVNFSAPTIQDNNITIEYSFSDQEIKQHQIPPIDQKEINVKQ